VIAHILTTVKVILTLQRVLFLIVKLKYKLLIIHSNTVVDNTVMSFILNF
jgi:hypothetical protein